MIAQIHFGGPLTSARRDKSIKAMTASAIWISASGMISAQGIVLLLNLGAQNIDIAETYHFNVNNRRRDFGDPTTVRRTPLSSRGLDR